VLRKQTVLATSNVPAQVTATVSRASVELNHGFLLTTT